MRVFGGQYQDMHITNWQRVIADYTPLVRDAAKKPSTKVIEMQQQQYGMLQSQK